MCGIVGCIATRNVPKILLEGLRRLEYRGYDSAGIAVIDKSDNNALLSYKVCGKVQALADNVTKKDPHGMVGIAHTRWATHGKVTKTNAHPQIANDRFAVVHNGIIENFTDLKNKMSKKGYKFQSDTDTEVIAVLLDYYHNKHGSLREAVLSMVDDIEGAYALAIIDAQDPEILVGVRHGAPLVVGIGEEENFLASDPLALLQVTDRFIYLGDDEIAFLDKDHAKIQNFKGKDKKHRIEVYDHGYQQIEKGDYSHYMLKEIYEQPQAIKNTLISRISEGHFSADFLGTDVMDILTKTENIYMVGCGTSYHTSLIARYQFAEFLGMNVLTETASEFRYMKRVIPPNCLYITISQSGETADILAALKDVNTKRKKAKRLSRAISKNSQELIYEKNILASMAICNMPASSLVRHSDLSLITAAGPEIGVASTKAFTSQLASLLLLIGIFMNLRGNKKNEQALMKAVNGISDDIEKVFKQHKKIKKLAEKLADYENAMFIGRGANYPVVMEGALKLKEISYVHAEAYQGGELKHGPLALIDKEFPTIAVMEKGLYLSKMISNMQEVKARGGPLFAFSNSLSKEINSLVDDVIEIPSSHPLINPILFTIALQILSYETAVVLGTDIDQPRNLAKSVTVE